jgi:hypothetical protein
MKHAALNQQKVSINRQYTNYNFMADTYIHHLNLVTTNDIKPNSVKSNETHFYKKSIACASLKTDSGTEFKEVFHKYLYDNGILHTVIIIKC